MMMMMTGMMMVMMVVMNDDLFIYFVVDDGDAETSKICCLGPISRYYVNSIYSLSEIVY